MQKYDYVEDYLEVIAGLRDPVTLKEIGMGWFDPVIKLARYDIPVLRNMSEGTLTGGALTQRQGELAIKIIEKYRRQLAGIGIDASKENLNVFRQAFRVIDEVKHIDIVNEEIIMQFQFDKKLIDELRDFANTSQGKCYWDRDSRQWRLALTEYNINWAHAWAKVNGFEISSQVQKYNDLVIHAESQPYAIQLQQHDDQLEIVNASDSMMRYIQDHIGLMGTHNLLALVDQSAILGYSVSDHIIKKFTEKFGKALTDLMLNTQCQCDDKDLTQAIRDIKAYSEETKRYPIVIYEPDLSNKLLSAFREIFAADEIDIIGNGKKNRDFAHNAKVVHSIRPVTRHRIPLLVTAAGVITGGERQMMIQKSEKVVFFSAGVYNSKNKSHTSHLYNAG